MPKMIKTLKKNLSAVGFEPTPVFTDQNTHLKVLIKLESGALDRSATLTSYKLPLQLLFKVMIKSSLQPILSI